ncbi:bifunctional lysylphosphatidylglycerol flippase/synthetase MprF [Bifidobacterium cuniculi]|uniref:Lysyl-tRNA synthetase n=1 Tax=Bifidobacterium cuniculi TaxID=1688 RepID=A0A087AT25_9BIFI|nr:DUF2156 domain-containing protein [Bifidobacterium cuniculi]KFI61925.1 lysyl-tRNA synthetase [Bifidobacterium cuniculi]
MSATQSTPGRDKSSRTATGGVGAQLLADLRRWAHEQRFALWVTFGLVVVNLCWWLWYAVQHKAAPYQALATTLGAFDLGRLLSSLVLTHNLFQLVVEAVLVLVVLCMAEPLMGAWRTVIASVASAVLGVFLGLLLCMGLSSLLGDVQLIYHIGFTLSPVMLVIGALMASTAFAYQLWRRRVRIVGYAAILVVLLYGGNPGDYCMLAAALIGQLLGRLMAGAPRERERWHWQRSSSREVRRIMGAIGMVLALGPVVAATSRTAAGPLTSLAWVLSPHSNDSAKLASCMHGEATVGCLREYALARVSMPGDVARSFLPLLVMIALAWGVYLGRRTAAIASIVFYAMSAVITLSYYRFMPTDGGSAWTVHGLLSCLINALIPLAYAIVLWVELSHFQIRTKTRTLRTSLVVMCCTLVACAAVYLVFGLVRPSDFSPRPGLGTLLAELPSRFLPVGFLTNTRMAFMPVTALASLVSQGVGVVFWAVLVVVSFAWLNASIDYDKKAHDTADALVEQGGESMSMMATWEGNEYWLSPTGRSAVAYRVLNRIALTTTGPFGDPEEWMGDLDEFARYCGNHSWSPVFYAIHEKQHDYLRQQGWHSIMVGEEMLIDPQAWKTTGKKWQDIRTAINKAKREGITDEFTTYAEASEDVQRQIEEISEQWSEGKALPEMKFTLGGVEELKDPRVPILLAIDADGTVQGVTSWLPTWRDGRIIGYTLDFMRYREGSYNGIMEFLIARMAQRMHDWGVEHPDQQVEYVSLSAAPLTGLDSYTDARSDDDSNIDGTTMLQHALALVADLLEPAYGFKSLYNFKMKFQPSERPVFISYPDSAMLANIGLAIVRAYLPTLTVKQALGMLKDFKPKKPAK